MKQNNGFILLEILLAVTLFALAATTLTYSLSNGLITKARLTRPNYNFDEVITKIITSALSKSEAESTRHIILPTGKQLNVTINVDTTTMKGLHKAEVQTDLDSYSLFFANNNW